MTISELSKEYEFIISLGSNKKTEDLISLYFMELVTVDSLDTFEEYLSLLSNSEMLYDIFLHYIMYMKVTLKLARNNENSLKYINSTSHLLFNYYKSKLLRGTNGVKFIDINDVVSKITCKFMEDIVRNNVNFDSIVRCSSLQVFKVGANSIEHKLPDGSFLVPKDYLENMSSDGGNANDAIDEYIANQNSLYTDFSKLILSNITFRDGNVFESYYVLYNMVLILLVSYSENIVNIITRTPISSTPVNENSTNENNLQVNKI